ncbi:hypothetical protein MG599_14545 [Paenarthrobacter sp. SD-1]|uniref:Uncharacterized protein n=2 Tax=Paenarthrobacter TaxID=1742992 RepID=A0AAX3EDW6_PAEUR|nr:MULTISPECIES: hypothetical protein [Paenarthrobacter]MDO5876501.1 hypothetical protein [Paenarthrobacter sp. SD-1]UYV96275.1 hypothetical protein NL394_14525 [Paenarthrobacter ureafaciens]
MKRIEENHASDPRAPWTPAARLMVAATTLGQKLVGYEEDHPERGDVPG